MTTTTQRPESATVSIFADLMDTAEHCDQRSDNIHHTISCLDAQVQQAQPWSRLERYLRLYARAATTLTLVAERLRKGIIDQDEALDFLIAARRCLGLPTDPTEATK